VLYARQSGECPDFHANTFFKNLLKKSVAGAAKKSFWKKFERSKKEKIY